MNSTKDITAASDNVNQFSSSGLSLNKLMAVSVTAFNSKLYENATPKAFLKTLTSHANCSAGIRLPDNLIIFGRQYTIPRDIADTLPLYLLPPGDSVQQAEPSLTGSTRRLVKSRYEPSPALFTCVRNLGA